MTINKQSCYICSTKLVDLKGKFMQPENASFIAGLTLI